jgi:hypothetical protein
MWHSSPERVGRSQFKIHTTEMPRGVQIRLPTPVLVFEDMHGNNEIMICLPENLIIVALRIETDLFLVFALMNTLHRM